MRLRAILFLALGVALGCGMGKPVTKAALVKDQTPVPVEGLPGCVAEKVKLEYESGTHMMSVVTCGQSVAALGCPACPACPQSVVTQPGCMVLPEVLSQGGDVLYTVKCPRR